MEVKKTEILLDLAEQNDGYVSVAEAASFGVAQTYLCMAEEEGLFQKVSKGLYRKRGFASDRFYELSFRFRKIVFARKSALFLHGIATDEDYEVNLPLNYMNGGIEGVACVHAGKKEYEVGQSILVTPRGNLANSYDLERTLIDLLRHHDQFDKDTFLALWNKGNEKSPYPEKLDAYARQFHVEGELSLLRKLY